MTLGPGAWGGSITSDNVTPMHLLNIKRLGREVRAYRDPLRDHSRTAVIPTEPQQSEAAMLSADDVQRVVDDFLRDFRGRSSR